MHPLLQSPCVATRALGALLAPLVLAACSQAPSGPREGEACSRTQWLGSFEGVSVGASSAGAADTLAGCAYFSVAPPSDVPATPAETLPTFGMVLTDGTAQSAVYRIKILRAGRVAPGTFVVGSGVGDLYGRVLLTRQGRTYVLSAGTLSVTAYANARDLAGTLAITATETVTGSTITITGRFTATCIDVPLELTNDDFVGPSRSNACQPGGSS